jgi:hypothetical protein
MIDAHEKPLDRSTQLRFRTAPAWALRAWPSPPSGRARLAEWTVTLHVNGAFLVTHDHSLGAFGGAIVEGPFKWPVRPVAELMVEEDSGRTIAGLVGGIWQVRDNLSLDLGWRVGESRGAAVREFRAGFTWAVPFRSRGGASPTGPLSVPPR